MTQSAYQWLSVALLSLTVVACSQSKIEHPTKQTIAKSKEEPVVVMHKRQDNSVYQNLVPKKVTQFLKTEMKGWSLCDLKSWSEHWFNEYKSPNCLASFVIGEFNGDKQHDYALVLEDKNGILSSWMLLSKRDGFKKVLLEEIGKPDGKIEMGLHLVDPGPINYIDPIAERTKPKQLENQGVEIASFERPSTTYYWAFDELKSLQTSP